MAPKSSTCITPKLDLAIRQGRTKGVLALCQGMTDSDLEQVAYRALTIGKGDTALAVTQQIGVLSDDMKNHCYYAFLDASKDEPWEHTKQWIPFLVREGFMSSGLRAAISGRRVDNATQLFALTPLTHDNYGGVMVAVARSGSPHMVRLLIEHHNLPHMTGELIFQLAAYCDDLKLANPTMVALICERFDVQDVIKAQEMAERDWALFSNSPGINKGREFFALLAAQYQKMTISQTVEGQGVAAARRSKI